MKNWKTKNAEDLAVDIQGKPAHMRLLRMAKEGVPTLTLLGRSHNFNGVSVNEYDTENELNPFIVESRFHTKVAICSNLGRAIFAHIDPSFLRREKAVRNAVTVLFEAAEFLGRKIDFDSKEEVIEMIAKENQLDGHSYVVMVENRDGSNEFTFVTEEEMLKLISVNSRDEETLDNIASRMIASEIQNGFRISGTKEGKFEIDLTNGNNETTKVKVFLTTDSSVIMRGDKRFTLFSEEV